jgi:hypothetical protein
MAAIAQYNASIVSRPNFSSFVAAPSAGNANSIVAFNLGVINRTLSITSHEDYIAGEVSDLKLISIKRVYDGKVDGTQLHILSNLGEKWGIGWTRPGDKLEPHGEERAWCNYVGCSVAGQRVNFTTIYEPTHGDPQAIEESKGSS